MILFDIYSLNININIVRLKMAQNQCLSNIASFYNIFKISLTKDQQAALTQLLPKSYSFQPFKCTRSLDQESLKSEPLKLSKKKQKQQKDPDYSASYASAPKQPPTVKLESTQTIPGGEPFLECYLILKKLKKSIYSWPFKLPVDPKVLGIPQYFNVVLQPMDLKTIQDNIRKQAYKHPAEFHRDIYKILMNSYKFNQKNSDVFVTTAQFEEEYLKVVKEAKQGKLIIPEKKYKMDSNISEESPLLVKKQQSSIEPKQTRPYHKKQKYQKGQQKQKQKVKIRQKEQKEKMKIKIEQLERQKERQRQRQRQRQKERQKERQKQRQRQRQREKQRQKQREKQKEKEKQRLRQKEKERQRENLQRQRQRQRLKQRQRQKEQFPKMFEDLFEPAAAQSHNKVKHGNKQHDQYSISYDTKKKDKNYHHEDHKKEKKNKEKKHQTENQKDITALKQVSLFENQKAKMIREIQKKLGDLNKKIAEYQLPKNKPKCSQKNNEGYEAPNLNNFTTVTSSEKKKLAERISMLPQIDFKYIIEICFRKRDKKRQQQGVYQIDLDKLDPKIIKQISNFVAMRTRQIKKSSKYKSEALKHQASNQASVTELQIENNADFDGQDYYYDNDNYQENQQNLLDEHENENQGLHLNHPLDDLEQHIHAPIHFEQTQLMEIDDRNNSDEYQPFGEDDHYNY